jgi:predicted nucleic acid-binding protein
LRFLVDTNVISAFAPTKQRPTRADSMAQWFDANTAELGLATVSILEIESGIQRLRRRGIERRAEDLSIWLLRIVDLYRERIVPMDVAIAKAAGAIEANAMSSGHAPGLADVIIAATARVRRLTVLTRNLRHFVPLEIPAFNPFQSLPEP